MQKGRIIAIGVGIAAAIIIGVGLAISVPPTESSQVNVTETPEGRHLELKLEEKIGIKEKPSP